MQFGLTGIAKPMTAAVILMSEPRIKARVMGHLRPADVLMRPPRLMKVPAHPSPLIR